MSDTCKTKQCFCLSNIWTETCKGKSACKSKAVTNTQDKEKFQTHPIQQVCSLQIDTSKAWERDGRRKIYYTLSA